METVKFTELDIKPEILKAVANMGFEAMSPIQAKAIPVELSGKDVIGQAQTGTGKTAAFGIPILQKVVLSLRNHRQLFSVLQESWLFRLLMRFVSLQNICHP